MLAPFAAAAIALAGVAGARPAANLGPHEAAWSNNYFVSPTGNIHCRYFAYERVLACKTLNNGRVAVVPLYGSAYVGFITNYSFPSGPVLYYGQTYTVRGQFRCVSQANGMFCRSVQTGRGFALAREGYRLL